MKQNELLKCQKDLTGAESELVQLRPLRQHLQHLNGEQHKQIEDATRVEFEKNKLNARVREMET